MKKNHVKKYPLLIALLLLIPFFWTQNSVYVSAAAPKFKEKKVTIVGAEETYQLVIENKVSGSTYKWSSSKPDVASVSSKGLVTAEGKGTTTIKCKITYPTKKTKTISCKVTVKIPATDIKINNASLQNGTHIMMINEKFNFNRDIFPSGSSDKTFWSISGGDPECITIDDFDSGIVTARKAGTVILKATAAEKATAEYAAKSNVSDAVIITVIEPSAKVYSAEIIGTNQIKVVFETPIDESTVIASDGKLLDSIAITLIMKDSKGNLAKDPGDLTASFSEDKKTLTIISENMFSGDYWINFTNRIKTLDGKELEPYNKQMSYIDTIGPSIKKIELDDTGMITTIHFSEPIDITNFKISDANLVASSKYSSYDTATLNMLKNRLNYVLSDDKTYLTINLSNIAPTDYDKTFSVVLSGIKDLAGNLPTSYTLTAVLRTDTTPKAQARPTRIVRSSYNTLTATFTRAIREPGYIIIDNGSMVYGTVDPKDNKKVNYILNDVDATLTGSIKVEIGFWDSYNVKETDHYAETMRSFKVNFVADKTSPVLRSYEFDQKESILTLNFNEEVKLISNSGIFSSVVLTVDDDMFSGTNIHYVQAQSDDDKVIKLKLSNMTRLGKYTFTLERGFIVDNFRNECMEREIVISNASGTSNELPGPISIEQSTANLNEIAIRFPKKVDYASAQNISNYKVSGATVISAKVIDNTTENGATVVITVADGTIDVSMEYPITISGVMGYNGSYAPMSAYTTTVYLLDNKRPTMIGNMTFDKTTLNTIKLIFNEEVEGTMDVTVTQAGGKNNYNTTFGTTVTVEGYTVYINLDSIPDENISLKVDINENRITDKNGNEAVLAKTHYVIVKYK
ncbi:MAG: hypothetical protein GX306_03825 [Clostridiales bacterium]|nr:hypothetical protein [Clostridiales bacterium]